MMPGTEGLTMNPVAVGASKIASRREREVNP